MVSMLRKSPLQTPPANGAVSGQVFFNLQTLWPQLKKLLGELLEEVRQAPLPANGFHQAEGSDRKGSVDRFGRFWGRVAAWDADEGEAHVWDEFKTRKSKSPTTKDF